MTYYVCLSLTNMLVIKYLSCKTTIIIVIINYYKNKNLDKNQDDLIIGTHA